MVRVAAYTVKDVGKDADYFRAVAKEVTGVDAFTEVHPRLVRFTFVDDVPDDVIEALDEKMMEIAEGVRASSI